mmetsp:Transcript_4953/g.10945  ORF Transcript_4953/g.10945 Transcript_4953/m.10945 type:complete len:270 (-) Transcript_4953:518-1327(-)
MIPKRNVGSVSPQEVVASGKNLNLSDFLHELGEFHYGLASTGTVDDFDACVLKSLLIVRHRLDCVRGLSSQGVFERNLHCSCSANHGLASNHASIIAKSKAEPRNSFVRHDHSHTASIAFINSSTLGYKYLILQRQIIRQLILTKLFGTVLSRYNMFKVQNNGSIRRLTKHGRHAHTHLNFNGPLWFKKVGINIIFSCYGSGRGGIQLNRKRSCDDGFNISSNSGIGKAFNRGRNGCFGCFCFFPRIKCLAVILSLNVHPSTTTLRHSR